MLSLTLSIMAEHFTLHNDNKPKCHQAECRILFIVKLNVVMLSVVMMIVLSWCPEQQLGLAKNFGWL
jgi:hypothetical protein